MQLIELQKMQLNGKTTNGVCMGYALETPLSEYKLFQTIKIIMITMANQRHQVTTLRISIK